MNERTPRLLVLATTAGFMWSCAAFAQTESKTGWNTEVLLRNCGSPPKIQVLPYNREELKFSADHGERFWTGESSASFPTQGSIFSVQFDGGRTNCAISTGDLRQGKWWAVLDLECIKPVWRALDVDPRNVPLISYRRVLPGAVPCTDERKDLPLPPRAAFLSFAWQHELIYVHFGKLPTNHLYLYYDLLLRNGGMFRGELDEISVKRADVIKNLRLRGRGSSNARQIDDLNLDKDVQTITLKRVK